MCWYKRLERERFRLPKADGAVYTLEAHQLEWLLSGLEVMKLTVSLRQACVTLRA